MLSADAIKDTDPQAPTGLQLQVASDLHLEFVRRRFPGARLIRRVDEADLLVLAGDIANGVDVVRAFGDWPVPVLYVMGNHEAYGRVYDEERKRLRAACVGTSIVFLDQDVYTTAELVTRFPAWAASRQGDLPAVRILGCTLWTGYRYSACGKSHEAQMKFAEWSLTDHRLIKLSEGPFDAQAALACHEADCRWLRRVLAQPFDGNTVVVTHHSPSERSVHPRFLGDPLTGAFVTDLPDLLDQVHLWIHGHHHDSSDFVERGCRVVCNPRGYPKDLHWVRSPVDLCFENQDFNELLLIDIRSTRW